MAKKEGRHKPLDELEKNKEGEGESSGEGGIGGASGEVHGWTTTTDREDAFLFRRW